MSKGSLLSFLSVTAMAALLPCAALAETPLGVTTLAEAKAMYDNDVQACRRGEVPEDLPTCLKEAQRAYEEAKREAMQQQRARAPRGKATSASQ
jgi:hypothetical protein